ncbi:MAG: type II secretion system protein GspM [Betaproteobacteria bacterium]
MNRLWKRYSSRIEAASLRERVMVFACAAVVLIALLNAVLIEPEFARQRRLSNEVAQRQGEIKGMQEQLQKLALARQADPDQVNRRQLEGLRRQIGELDAQLSEEQRKFAPPERIGALLEEMLSRNRRLQLVDLRTLPAAALGAAGAADKPAVAKPAAGKPGATPAGGAIYRHGVEITVTGSYLDLLAYLRDLEKLPSQMYWGKLDLSVTAHPQVTLKLSVYTLSLDLAWLIV